MVCYTVTKVEGTDMGAPSAMTAGGGMRASGFQFGIRKQDKPCVTALKVSKDSHRIRKPPLPLPQVQYRAPIIIHTHSPEVIHTEPDDFMSLVQKLTGSSVTRLRLKRKPAKKSAKSGERSDLRSADRATDDACAAVLAHGGEGIRGQAPESNCASPSSSEESAFLSSGNACGSAVDLNASVKQTNSPRGPLSNCEFDSQDMSIFTPFDPSSATPGVLDLLSHVKAEPSFSYADNSLNFFSDHFTTAQPASGPTSGTASGKPPRPSLPKPSLPKPQLQHEYGSYHGIDINSPLPSPSWFSPGLSFLPELSPGTAAWSQTFLDCLNGSPKLANQPPLQRQRAYSGGYSPGSEGTMVALENIQAFMLT